LCRHGAAESNTHLSATHGRIKLAAPPCSK
jgi:hypothetical protein